MKDLFETSKGAAVLDVQTPLDYITLIFDDKSHVTIMNKNRYSGQDIEKLKGFSLINFARTKEYVLLSFSNGETLTIGLKPNDFCGPEALIYKSSNGQTYVDRGEG